MATKQAEKDYQMTEDGVSSHYTDHDLEEMNSLGGNTFTFNHASFPWRDIVILQDETPAYYAEISGFTPNKPDITLRRSDSDGELVGQAHFRWSFSIKAGVGPSDVNMQWTNMKRGGIFHKRHYGFEWKGNEYSLRRTHSMDQGMPSVGKMMLSHMKVTDTKTGKLLAVYISQPGLARKRGTLRLANDAEADLERLIILGIASWREKVARSRRRVGGSGGGGGSN